MATQESKSKELIDKLYKLNEKDSETFRECFFFLSGYLPGYSHEYSEIFWKGVENYIETFHSENQELSQREDHQANLLRFQHAPAWPKDSARDGLD